MEVFTKYLIIVSTEKENLNIEEKVIIFLHQNMHCYIHHPRFLLKIITNNTNLCILLPCQ